MATWVLIIFLINPHNDSARTKIIGSYADGQRCATAAHEWIAAHHDKRHTLDYTCEYTVEPDNYAN